MSTIIETILGTDTGSELKDKCNANFVARHSLDVATKTGAYTATTNDQIIICDASGGAFSVTLYAVSGNAGRVIEIVKIDSSGNAVTVDGNASETLNNATTQSLASRYSSIRLWCSGTEWVILSKNL